MSNFDSQGRFVASVEVIDPTTAIGNFTADGRVIEPVFLTDPTTGLPYAPGSGGGGSSSPAPGGLYAISQVEGLTSGVNVSSAVRLANYTALQAALDHCQQNNLKGIFDSGSVYEFTSSTGFGLNVQAGLSGNTFSAFDASGVVFIQFGTNEPVITIGATSGSSYHTNLHWTGGVFGYGVDQTGHTGSNAVVFGKHYNSSFDNISVSQYAWQNAGGSSVTILPYRSLYIHATGTNTFFFGCRSSGFMLGHAQQNIFKLDLGGTDCIWERWYCGGGGPGTQTTYANDAPFSMSLSGSVATTSGIFDEINVEWCKASTIFVVDGHRGATFRNCHFEGNLMTGWAPSFFSCTNSIVSFEGGQWLDNTFNTSNGITGGQSNWFNCYTGQEQIDVRNIEFKYSGATGYNNVNVRFVVNQNAFATNMTFTVRNVNWQTTDTQIFDLDEQILGSAAGIIRRIDDYRYNVAFSKTQKIQTTIPAGTSTVTMYGQLKDAFIAFDAPLTAARGIILSNVLASSGFGSTCPREIGDVVTIQRTGNATGAFTLTIYAQNGTTALTTLTTASTKAAFIWNGYAWTLSGGSVSGPCAFNAQTGTTYTLTIADNNSIVNLTNASAITLTLPNNLPLGFNCLIVQGGAGQVTLSPASGATMVNRLGFTKLAGEYASGSLIITANSTGTAAVYNFGGDGA